MKPTDTILHVNQDIKETIIEGIATLYAVDEKKERNAQKLAKSLQQLPEVNNNFYKLNNFYYI